MRTRRAVVGGALAAFLALAPVGGASHKPFPGSVSWADSRHGWAPNHEKLCKPTQARSQGARVCATENGGRTWRTIFVGGNYIFTALRTSPQAGIVSTGAYGHTQYWTRDNGRHWYGTQVAGGSGGFNARHPSFVGKGAHLYWVRAFEDTVYQVTPWPPTAPATCSGTWAHSAFSEEDAAPDGNHCHGEAVEAGMRSTPVISGHGAVVRWALVPDGLFVLGERPDGTLTSIVRRGGANTARELPPARLPEFVQGSIRRLRVEWPAIVVGGVYFSAEGKNSWQVIWRSSDGGTSWRVDVQRGWSTATSNPIARAATAAGVLGDEVILAGGRFSDFRTQPGSGGDVSRLVQAYRPSDDRWRPLPDLPVAVAYAAGASNGRELYVVGGFDARGRPQRGAFVLRDRAWHRLPAVPEPRAGAGAAIVGERLYVVGGLGRSGLARRTLVLDLRRNRWSAVPGPRPRAYLGVAAVRGRIVAAGGRIAGAATSLALAESWRPGERRWRRLPPLPSPRSENAVVALDDGVVSLGGADTEYYRPLASAVLLRLGARRWEALPELRTPRYGVAAAVLGDGLYALVGEDDYGPNGRGTSNEFLRLAP